MNDSNTTSIIDLFKEYTPLNPKARFSMIISSIVFSTIAFTILFIVRGILLLFKVPNPVIFCFNAIILLGVVIAISELILSPTIRYNRYRYRINEESVECIRGVLFLNHDIIPIRRMQQVNITQGPINKLFNLSDIEVITAGSSLKIDYLTTEDANIIAEKLKNDINEFALLQAKEVAQNEI